jgi:hypothetical protein
MALGLPRVQGNGHAAFVAIAVDRLARQVDAVSLR